MVALGFLDLDPDPLRQFLAWLAEAQATGLREPTAMTLATADAEGRPSARVVLMRGHDERGFMFYTNYESRKGHDLAVNPRAALVFYWDPLGRQVRIEGDVRRLDRADSDAYFRSRPRGSRIAAWASAQSRAIASRASLETAFEEAALRFPGEEVPLPPYWGGYIVAPEAYEFWEGRPDRLHDRLRYTRGPDGSWRRVRLSP
jgi:pyridoxamine 5'-phosphate oxidase